MIFMSDDFPKSSEIAEDNIRALRARERRYLGEDSEYHENYVQREYERL